MSQQTQTMKLVVGLFVSMDKIDLNKSQHRMKVGSYWPKLRAEYGKSALSALKDELKAVNSRASINISTLNVWASIHAFSVICPAIEMLSEKLQRRYATLFDAGVTKNGESPKLNPKVSIPADCKKWEFPKLREIAEDTDIFNKTFGVKVKASVIRVTDKQVTDLFSRLRKMKQEEQTALLALIKKELSAPVNVKPVKGNKVKTTTVVAIPVPLPSPTTENMGAELGKSSELLTA